MKAQAFPLLVVAGPHANSRLGVVEAGRGLRELSAWLREREARALIFTEGEWDLAAAADLMAWGLSDRTKRIAIFGNSSSNSAVVVTVEAGGIGSECSSAAASRGRRNRVKSMNWRIFSTRKSGGLPWVRSMPGPWLEMGRGTSTSGPPGPSFRERSSISMSPSAGDNPQ